MAANYFIGAVVLMLTTDIAFSTDLCLCPENIYRYSSDCCSIHSLTTMKPTWNIWTSQKPVWHMSSTTRPVLYARTTAKPIWKQLTTRSAFLEYLLSRRHQIWDINTTPKTTRQTLSWRVIQQILDNIRQPTRIPSLDSYDFGRWSTTQRSDTGSGLKAIGISVGLIIGCGFLSFFAIAAWVIVKRRRQRAILKRQRQLQTQHQHQPPSRPRILVRRSPVPPNMGNLPSNPELNLNVPRTGTYAYGAYGQEPVTQGSTPPNTPASLPEPVTPYAPPPYTLSSHSEPDAPVAPPPYTPAAQSEPVAPVAPPPYTLASPSVLPPPYSENI